MPEDMNEAVSDILGSGADGLADDIMVAAVENYVHQQGRLCQVKHLLHQQRSDKYP